MDHFTYAGSSARIVFGSGTIRQLPSEIERLGCRRVLVLSTPHQKSDAEALAVRLGALAAGIFTEAVMHTPVDVTARAMQAFAIAGADAVVSLGGGTTVGLGKAIAYRNDTPQVVIATTYAGSEVTPILGQTENGVKTTVKDPRILPETVIYDPDLTSNLPVLMSVTSGLNAIAHSVEGLYATDRNPISSLMALDGIRAMRAALPRIVADPRDVVARGEALYAAWLCGTVLGTVGMSLHHKLCHVLGGSFDLPHADTHSVILPYSTAYNGGVATKELAPLRSLFGDDLGMGIKAFGDGLGAPRSLQAIGMAHEDLDRAADLALANAYANPRPLERDAIRDLLERAWHGASPA